MPLTEHDFERAQVITGYDFRDRSLLSDALQSALKDRDEATGEIRESDGNRRLAKLGYTVMELAITEEWFCRGMGHGDLDLLRRRLLIKEYLSDMARQSGLHTCLSMSIRQENIAAPPTTMRLVLTAVVGAVWLDAGSDVSQGLINVKRVMQKLGFFDWDFLNSMN